ncbi:hypothetical protein GCM10011385_21650 [Nitratireductor aestuarii]|uniref:Uncharacterized protein n=1 Tax=Nitratireductor aestuarii TaxID=1735103 RepID=A0A916W569_9HYPH|nr:hypothetical protein GCM10011385_21650 [Nitratireductor aestuarii]
MNDASGTHRYQQLRICRTSLIGCSKDVFDWRVLAHPVKISGEGIAKQVPDTVNEICFGRNRPATDDEDAFRTLPGYLGWQLRQGVLAAMDAAGIGSNPEILKMIRSCHPFPPMN